MSRRASDKQRRINRERGKRVAPAIGPDGMPVNYTRPAPPPARDPVVPGNAPAIIVRHGAHPPPHVLTGADMMADDRVCNIDRATGRVKVYRRAATWRPHDDDKTSKFLLTLLDEIRRLRVEAGLPEFDN